MNTINLLEAVGQVNDSYITAVMEEKPVFKKNTLLRRRLLIAAAACFCMIIGALIYQQITGNPSAVDFAITAYAKNPENGTLLGRLLEISEPVPIDVLYFDSGNPYFLFSYVDEDSYAAGDVNEPCFAIYCDYDYHFHPDHERIGEELLNVWSNLNKTPGSVYLVYYTNPDRQTPFSIYITIDHPKEDNALARTAVLNLTQIDGQYNIELVKIEKTRVRYSEIDDSDPSIYNEEPKPAWSIDTHH